MNTEYGCSRLNLVRNEYYFEREKANIFVAKDCRAKICR